MSQFCVWHFFSAFLLVNAVVSPGNPLAVIAQNHGYRTGLPVDVSFAEFRVQRTDAFQGLLKDCQLKAEEEQKLFYLKWVV